MEHIVTDEVSLKEAAEALGYSVVKKVPLIHLDLCMECGKRPQHMYSRRWNNERWDKAKYELIISLKCKGCGKRVNKIFTYDRTHGIPSKAEDNVVRELWNEQNKIIKGPEEVTR